jgi:hypothetical protein
MDTFTRNYLIALGVIVLAVAILWFASREGGVGDLNTVLRDDPLVAAYPYTFRARSVKDGVAEMYTPRSAELSAVRFVGMIRPDLAGLTPDAPEMVEAQMELARVQQRAREVVLAQPGIDSVTWVPDERWYEQRGVIP